MLLWLKNLWVAFWAVNQVYPVGWWITIFHPPILAQATMLVSLRGNLRPLLILDMLVMFHGFSGIFWLKKHQFLQRLQVLIAWKIAAVLITCALDQRQMEREFAWFLLPGTLTSLLKWIRHHWNICLEIIHLLDWVTGFGRWAFGDVCCDSALILLPPSCLGCLCNLGKEREKQLE